MDVIVIGHNKEIKQETDMGKQNNQNFISIPHMRAVRILKEVVAGYGSPSILREESYTSKASFLDMDPIPDHGKGTETSVFSGKRVNRGMYWSKDGRLINADINGALNIVRKEYPDAFQDTGDLSYLTGTVERIIRNEICGVKSGREPSGKRRVPSAARKLNRREHCYRKRMYEKLFTGMSARKRIETGKSAAIAKNRGDQAA